jgi:hypothetical protein
VGSPVRKSTKGRPKSIQQIITESKILKKVKPRVSSSAANDSTVILPESVQKLPGIVLKPRISEHVATISPKKLIKHYEFEPSSIFSRYEDKLSIQSEYFKQRSIDQQNSEPSP